MKWIDELLKKYVSGIAHMFLLHFNIADYVDNSNLLTDYLIQALQKRDIILLYDRASGLTLPSQRVLNQLDPAKDRKEMEDILSRLMELGSPQEDDITAMLRQVNGGSTGSNEELALPRNPVEALPFIEQTIKKAEVQGLKVGVIIDFAETLVPNSDISMMSPDDRVILTTLIRWGRDVELATIGSPIFMITGNINDIHPAIRAASSKVEQIEIPIPNFEERLKFIEFMLESGEEVQLDVDIQQFANMTAGLSKINIEDIKLRALAEGIPITAELIKERKDDIIASEFGEVIDIEEPTYGFELLGGLEHVKTFLTRNIINPIRKGNTRRVPMGVLFTGPAGTGKTAMAKALAKEAGFNFVNLDLSKILGQYVGNSERNLAKALRCIEALAPSIVFIDEIDQAIQRGGNGGSSVNNNIFKMLLEFMGDTSHRGKVVFLAATNRPDLMDAALRRAGRFDKKIPFLAPEEPERILIFKTMFKKYNQKFEISEEEFKVCGKASEGYTGAEIESIVIKAIEVAEDNEKDVVTFEDLKYALEAISPSTADVEFMTNLAIQECNDKDLLPPQYRKELDNRKELEEKLSRMKAQRGKREM